MNALYPVTIYIAPVEYEALHDFYQYHANLVVNRPIKQVTNEQLLVADYYRRTFTHARSQAFTTAKRRQSGKRYALKIGLIYARILLKQLHDMHAVGGLLVHVNNELALALVELGDNLGIKRLS